MQINNFEFWLRTNCKFGAGISLNLPTYLGELGFKRVGLIVDTGLVKNAEWKKVRKVLTHSLDIVAVLESNVSEPDYDYLDYAKSFFIEKTLDCLIAAGGGSILDLGKAISVLITNPGKAIEYRGFNLVQRPGVPFIAIPTTAGTGSEVTPNAVFTDTKEMRKLGINTTLYVPVLVLLDPQLTLSCPPSVTISSGMDALVHTLESYVSKKSNYISKIFSKEAFVLIFNNLGKLIKDPLNVELRAKLQLGAFFAGTALMNSGAGPTGAMSYPLGVRYKVPHGLAGAVFLPEVIQFNIEHGCTLYGELFDLIENVDQTLPLDKKSFLFSEYLRALCDKLVIPRKVTFFSMSLDHIDDFVRQTMLLKGALDQNPIPFGEEEIRFILRKMF